MKHYWKCIDGTTDRYTLVDDAPEWLLCAVRDAHQGDLPNDWIFAVARDACDAIDSGDLKSEDDLHQFADDHVDMYTKESFAWAADMCNSATFCTAEDEYQETSGCYDSVSNTLMVIQYHAIYFIASVIFQAWEANRASQSA